MPPCVTLSPNAGPMVSDFSSAALLKRKRPAMIHIPVATFSSIVETTPRMTMKKVDELVEEGDGYAVHCRRGTKRDLEDRFSALVIDQSQAFFGVFDGHGGATAAEFAAAKLGRKMLDEVVNASGEVEKAIKDAYLTTDSEYLKQNVGGGGACSVTALIHQGSLAVSNAGDCRAVLCRGGVAQPLTIDHKPSREDERRRIEATGGYVDCCRGGVWRIQSSLAVSRAIGDKHLKKWVTAEPETITLVIQPDFQFLILASDGVWDKVTNQEAVDVVQSCAALGYTKANLARACKELVELSINRGSYDDTSALVIDFGPFIA